MLTRGRERKGATPSESSHSSVLQTVTSPAGESHFQTLKPTECYCGSRERLADLTRLAKMQKEYLIEMDDVVVVTKDDEGKVKLHEAQNLTALGAMSGGF